MKAVVFRGKEDLRVEEVPEPKILEQTDIIVKVTLSTICGSDLHILHGLWPGPPLPPLKPGSILGHEFVGEVKEVGKEVKNLKVGDKVTTSLLFCGTCAYCRDKKYPLCENLMLSGAGELPGAQAEYLRLPRADVCVWKLPKELPDEDVLFVSDNLSTGYFAAECGQIHPGDTVAVFGCGPVGLCAQICAKLFGPTRIIAVDKIGYRLKVAEEKGAIPINAGAKDPVAEIKRLTNGRGADVVIEAVGVKDTVLHCFGAVKKGGNLSWVGVATSAIEIPWHELIYTNITIRGGWTFANRIPELIKLIEAKKIDTKFLITHQLSLDRAVEGYEIFDKKMEDVLKVALKP